MNHTDGIVQQMHAAIVEALPGAEVHVGANSPGHFELRVVWPGFAELSRLKQQQVVYAAIAPLMKGDGAPVHAIDRLDTVAGQ